jgi:hypothetical protein
MALRDWKSLVIYWKLFGFIVPWLFEMVSATRAQLKTNKFQLSWCEVCVIIQNEAP